MGLRPKFCRQNFSNCLRSQILRKNRFSPFIRNAVGDYDAGRLSLSHTEEVLPAVPSSVEMQLPEVALICDCACPALGLQAAARILCDSGP